MADYTEIERGKSEDRPLIKAEEIIPLHKDVLVYDMYFGEKKTTAGIIILDDNKKDRGIHPRWAKVYAVGSKQVDVKKDDWVLIEHGRWSRGIDLEEQGITLRRVDPKCILGISENEPNQEEY